MMKKSVLRSYARLIAERGVNVRKGQDVIIRCDLDQPEFVDLLVEECYKRGAGRVNVEWSRSKQQKIQVRRQSLKRLSSLDSWEEAKLRYNAEKLPCMIHLTSADPDGLKGIDTKKLAASQQAIYPLIKPYRDQMEDRYQWCIAAVPGEKWAKKLFPSLRKGQAIECLWEKILSASRVEEGRDPVEAWREHSADLRARCERLNAMKIRSLHYTAANGTDLTVGLIPGSIFCGGSETSLQGIDFEPNIPTEECFISPMRGEAEGIVYSTMPLSWRGQMIDGFRIRFEKGKAVEWHAQQGEELLGRMITMDEGSAFLGECALVPEDSPVRKSGILFYNTLFDENAACHLALGRGFAQSLPDNAELAPGQALEKGINDSMIHMDFMIGCDTMDIDAVTEDGETIPVFRGGKWAF